MKMNKIFGVMVLISFMIFAGISEVSAIHYIPECQDSGNLLWKAEFNYSNGNITQYNLNYTEVCDYGCEKDFNVCNPPDSIRYIYVLLVIFGMIAVFVGIKKWVI